MPLQACQEVTWQMNRYEVKYTIFLQHKYGISPKLIHQNEILQVKSYREFLTMHSMTTTYVYEGNELKLKTSNT